MWQNTTPAEYLIYHFMNCLPLVAINLMLVFLGGNLTLPFGPVPITFGLVPEIKYANLIP